MAKAPSTPVAIPGTFRPSGFYLLFLGILGAGGIGATYAAFHTHSAQSLGVVSGLTGVLLGLFLVVLSTTVKVDDDGIVERWILGKNATAWDQIGTIDKMSGKGVALKNTSGRNLTLLTLLSGPVQDAIVEEVIRRSGLRKVSDDKTVKQNRRQGIIEQWTK